MDCDDARTEISARLDGEDNAAAWKALDAHLETCSVCRAYAEEAARLHRGVRLRAAEPVPDLTAGILSAIGIDASSGRVGGLRLALGVVGLAQVVLALPALVLGEDAGVPAHTARHLGSFAVALGIGFVVAAWRPSRVGGLLMVTAVLVGCLMASSAIDVATNDARAESELGGHATELMGLGLLWLLTSGPPWSRPHPHHRRSRGLAHP